MKALTIEHRRVELAKMILNSTDRKIHYQEPNK